MGKYFLVVHVFIFAVNFFFSFSFLFSKLIIQLLLNCVVKCCGGKKVTQMKSESYETHNKPNIINALFSNINQ